jgi:hypothetical protein
VTPDYSTRFPSGRYQPDSPFLSWPSRPRPDYPSHLASWRPVSSAASQPSSTGQVTSLHPPSLRPVHPAPLASVRSASDYPCRDATAPLSTDWPRPRHPESCRPASRHSDYSSRSRSTPSVDYPLPILPSPTDHITPVHKHRLMENNQYV